MENYNFEIFYFHNLDLCSLPNHVDCTLIYERLSAQYQLTPSIHNPFIYKINIGNSFTDKFKGVKLTFRIDFKTFDYEQTIENHIDLREINNISLYIEEDNLNCNLFKDDKNIQQIVKIEGDWKDEIIKLQLHAKDLYDIFYYIVNYINYRSPEKGIYSIN
jgi:hypothetical protein